MGVVRTGITFLLAAWLLPVAAARAQPGMVQPVAGAPGDASLDGAGDAYVVATPARRYGLGYVRGAGLGNYGVSAAMTAGKRLVPQVLLFGFHSDGQTGFAVAPAIQLSFVDNRQNSPFLAAGVQYHQLWFGDSSGNGLGGFMNLGWELFFGDRVAFQFGFGLNIKQTIVSDDGVVRMSQAPVFGLHWDAGLRVWL
jgi:hypothetical protein